MDTVLNPLLYIAFALIIWQCYRLRAWHRRYWGVGLFLPQQLSLIHLVTGIAMGTVLSAIFTFSGWDFALTVANMWWLWAATLLLGLVRVRFMAISYTAGLVSVVAIVCQKLNITVFASSLQQIDVAHLLLFAGVMTAVSGLLTMWQGDKARCPLLLPWRGKPIGAIVLQSFWAVPVLIQTSGGWLVLPVLLVYADIAIARSRQTRARLSGLAISGFGLTVAALAWASLSVEALLWVGAVWALLGQELVIWWAHRQEHRGTPKYQVSAHGIRVLEIQQGSPAAQMGILSGETIIRANGQAVNNMTELYAALQRSPAFCRLEIINEHGEQRFTQRSRYAGEPHQLGVVPVEASAQTASRYPHRLGWWQLLIGRTHYRRNITEKPLDQ